MLSGLNNCHFSISSVIEYFLQFNLMYRYLLKLARALCS